MKIRKQNIERRAVIEAYANYDCSKTSRPLPEFQTWDWSRADAIDREMCRAHLKVGVPAGYQLWDEVEVTTSDLLECAVHDKIFPGQSRKLGRVAAGTLDCWKLKCDRPWYKGITSGQTLDETAPMLLRPAVPA